MGKLTKSLQATTQKLSDLKHGIGEMQQLGRQLADNTLEVADAALRTGYAYAKAEAEMAANQSIDDRGLPMGDRGSTAAVHTKTLPNQPPRWTDASLKAQFGTLKSASKYLQTRGIATKSRTWKKMVETFNASSSLKSFDLESSSPDTKASEPISLEQRVQALENLVAQQAQQILSLEKQIRDLNQKKLQPKSTRQTDDPSSTAKRTKQKRNL